ncbi:hypothetical protein C0993_009868 [Termitomyces sp. T159_Od127]|nr:hypothetical protein C0993_009868 [Termitomyces sp. T159_Od127]
MTSTPEHLYGHRCGPATSPHTATVSAMQKPRHFVEHCLLGLEVHYLFTVEQEKLLLQLLATKDAAEALSPDELALELALEKSGACALLLGLEEDF